ncbi:MAG: VanZ family protein [Candidatus Nomurabacteria bacterium]|nr:VanZ family protein [Candidatus Nomurabacteria bacterium]
MKKRLIPVFVLILYIAFLIKIMVFKDVPLIRVGSLMLNFGGTQAGQANFLPLKTILPYLLGEKGWIIAGINLVGNIILLLPIGFLVPLVFRNMTWKKSLVLAVVTGFAIEAMQVVLHVGIFDIDDVILNALGVMIGYWAFVIISRWIRSKKYKNLIIAAVIVIATVSATLYAAYEELQQPVRSGVGQSDNGDLCGGTGGTGQIISTGNNTIVMKRGDGKNQIVNFTSQTTIKTSNGPASQSDLKTGDRITLVGGPNPDGSFTADAVFVCSLTGSETQK